MRPCGPKSQPIHASILKATIGSSWWPKQAPLAEVYYHNNRKCLRYPGYNIFNEYINVAQNDMRLCKSKDNLSSELFPVMLGLTALDYRRASVGLSRRMFSSRPDWLISESGVSGRPGTGWRRRFRAELRSARASGRAGATVGLVGQHWLGRERRALARAHGF